MNIQQKTWQQLQQKNIVSGEYQANETVYSPWFVKLLLAFSGWVASLFILGFFLLTLHDAISDSVACFLIGSGFIVLAYFLLRSNPHEFLEHLMLATSLAGQALIAWALFANNWASSPLVSWLILFALQSVLAIFMPHYIHRVCSALFASIALIISFHYLQISLLSSATLLFAVTTLVLNEWRFPRYQPSFEALSYGIVIVLIALQASNTLGYEITYWLSEHNGEQTINHYLDETLLLLVMLYLVITLIKRSAMAFSLLSRITIIGTTICFCLLSMQAPGITVGLAILVLGFSNSNKVLQGLGTCALLYYIGSYYYLLTFTLLQKSASLLVVGLFLLLLRYLLLTFANPLKPGVNNEA
ncbi:DUF4401 domain-containing protein [Psychromonas sp. Urea-02u-13]|uniref:DUF4401 domain-containing protein n=1 Tax=Psychromonas sp. Urea-02u-13 TaxID=2058326 RepID=UPI000C33C9E3|nr:DUF4401 domain-containing protein [Psychromonas sp. Urea-02u-13]PKG40120.1 hypothetical protein CXF74_04720 [Psychromonas sp. Urea-02u-13]